MLVKVWPVEEFRNDLGTIAEHMVAYSTALGMMDPYRDIIEWSAAHELAKQMKWLGSTALRAINVGWLAQGIQESEYLEMKDHMSGSLEKIDRYFEVLKEARKKFND